MRAHLAIEQAVRGIHPLRVLRMGRGLSLQQLAAEIEIHPNTLYRMELGHHQPQEKTRRRILLYFGIDFADHLDVFGALPDTRRMSYRDAS